MKQVTFKSASGSPDTVEWHVWRMGGIGGSDAPIIAAHAGLLAEKPGWMKSIDWLFKAKTGQIEPEDLSNNPAVMRGKKYEQAARQRFEEVSGIDVLPVFGEMDEHNFVRASFDGMTFDGDAIVEIKVPSRRVHEMALSGKIVEYYVHQVVHQALVAWGHPESWSDQEVYYVTFDPEENEIAIVATPAKVMRHHAEALLAEEVRFWGMVAENSPPCGREWLALAAIYNDLCDQLEAIEADIKATKSRLVDLMGDKRRVEGGGVIAVRQTRKGDVDYRRLLGDLLPDADKDAIEALCDKYRKPASESVAVRRQQGVLA